MSVRPSSTAIWVASPAHAHAHQVAPDRPALALPAPPPLERRRRRSPWSLSSPRRRRRSGARSPPPPDRPEPLRRRRRFDPASGVLTLGCRRSPRVRRPTPELPVVAGGAGRVSPIWGRRASGGAPLLGLPAPHHARSAASGEGVFSLMPLGEVVGQASAPDEAASASGCSGGSPARGGGRRAPRPGRGACGSPGTPAARLAGGRSRRPQLELEATAPRGREHGRRPGRSGAGDRTSVGVPSRTRERRCARRAWRWRGVASRTAGRGRCGPGPQRRSAVREVAMSTGDRAYRTASTALRVTGASAASSEPTGGGATLSTRPMAIDMVIERRAAIGQERAAGCPVIGMMPMVMPMFSKIWNTSIASTPTQSRLPKASRAQRGRPPDPPHHHPEQRQQRGRRRGSRAPRPPR